MYEDLQGSSHDKVSVCPKFYNDISGKKGVTRWRECLIYDKSKMIHLSICPWRMWQIKHHNRRVEEMLSFFLSFFFVWTFPTHPLSSFSSPPSPVSPWNCDTPRASQHRHPGFPRCLHVNVTESFHMIPISVLTVLLSSLKVLRTWWWATKVWVLFLYPPFFAAISHPFLHPSSASLSLFALIPPHIASLLVGIYGACFLSGLALTQWMVWSFQFIS